MDGDASGSGDGRGGAASTVGANRCRLVVGVMAVAVIHSESIMGSGGSSGDSGSCGSSTGRHHELDSFNAITHVLITSHPRAQYHLINAFRFKLHTVRSPY